MAPIRSTPQRPLPWIALLRAVLALWLAPVVIGLAGLAAFAALGNLLGERGLALWFIANALLFSPLFSWIGWLIALPAVALALHFGGFGWGAALAIGAAAGFLAGELAQSEIAVPFGALAVLALRVVLGRHLPL